MTEHDKTFWAAAKSSGMVAAFTINFAATVADIEGTQSCLRVHTCKEVNPIFGSSNPSRARAYGIAIPLNLALYSFSAWLKKSGQGNFAFGLLWASTVSHVYFGASGFANTPTSNLNSATQARFTLARKL